ncbi:LRR domain-containing protein [Naegleria gruberi]|uniref:LRR domain-containing protein n=1 Tax=Naegleria gruberi TaxID=5762 RepID=D2VVC2_NAEGR|nr:LRR domain-containing protein [Naegleria gruberi]EFC39210.1 LRR domain-containing protein [Naegleria gruberi]|eukprot:XP_002671954.1 LRR domain-containing protein [Naegleria gruberi strain NEG-M]
MKKRHSTFSTTINHRDLIKSSNFNSLSTSNIQSSSSPILSTTSRKGFRERPLIKFILKQRSKRLQQQGSSEFAGAEVEILKACWRKIEEEEMKDYRENLSNRLGFYFDDEELLAMFGNQLMKDEEELQQRTTMDTTNTEPSSAGGATLDNSSLKSGDSARSLTSFGSDSKLNSPISPNLDKKHLQSTSSTKSSTSFASFSGAPSSLTPSPNIEENKNLSYLYDIHTFPSKLNLIPTMHYNVLDVVELSSVQQIVNITSPSSEIGILKDCTNDSSPTVNIESTTFSLEILDSFITVDSFEDFSNPSYNPLNIRHLYCDYWSNKLEFKQRISKSSLTSNNKKENEKSKNYIPFEELEKCRNCTELKLNNNKIRSLDSKHFTNFAHLTELNLSSNRMSKARLPEDIFSHMPHLQRLSLDYMGLKTLPKSINKLVELTYLSLSFNKLNTFNLLHGKDRHLNDFWPKLTNLEYLNLSGNRLNRFPSEICNCKSLEFLSLSNNRIINEIPKEIENLKKLAILFLNGNKVTALDINRNLEFLENLTHLELGHNPNIHVVPPPVYNLTKLESLCLSHLTISHLSDDIGKLRNLTHLDLYGSKLTGLPKGISQLINLRNLDMRYCRGIKEFPIELFGQKVSSSTITTTSPMKSLTRLSLSYTMIESIPEDISSLQSLQALLVNDCPLLEEIKGIDKLVNLVEFDISRCISLVEPPSDVCERGLAHIRGYLKEKDDGPSIFLKFIGSVFGGNTSNNSSTNKKKLPSPIGTENNLKVEHNELLVASPVPSINSGDDDGDSDSDDEIGASKKKKPSPSGSTVKSLFSFWK